MHIALIMPENKRKSYLDGRWIMKHTKGLTGNMLPPAALMTIAALTPKEICVTIIDENVESIDFDTDVDLVAISAYTSAAPRAYEIAANFRKRGVTVIMGGIHASMLPEEAICYADSVVVGEAEGVWNELLVDYKKIC